MNMRSDITAESHPGCGEPNQVASQLQDALPGEAAEEIAQLFKTLGDPTRVRLLGALLVAGELCVNDLSKATDTAESTVSQSLRVLRAASIVKARRDGRLMYYRIADSHVRLLLDLTSEHIAHETTDGAGPS